MFFTPPNAEKASSSSYLVPSLPRSPTYTGTIVNGSRITMSYYYKSKCVNPTALLRVSPLAWCEAESLANINTDTYELEN